MDEGSGKIDQSAEQACDTVSRRLSIAFSRKAACVRQRQHGGSCTG
jgi:hypothetical protein